MGRLLFVGLGGFVGTLARYWLSGLVARRYGETFPFGTLVVNAVGCFVIGFLFYYFYDRSLANPTFRTVIFIGLLGGFTTFSSYGLQTFTLLRRRGATRLCERSRVQYRVFGAGLDRLHSG